MCDKGTVYGPGAQVTVDDDVALHWRAHGWATVTSTGAPSTSSSYPNPDHHTHLGADVPPPPATGVDEVQHIAVTGTPAGGNMTLTFGADTTIPITWPWTADAIQNALEALPSIGLGNVFVRTVDAANWTVEFTRDLGSQDVAQLSATDNLKPAGSTTIAVTTTTPGSPTRTASTATQEPPARAARRGGT